MLLRPALCLALALSATACATATPHADWVARTDADLTADYAACSKEAASINIQSTSDYSSRYGAAAAMAGRLDSDDLRGGGQDRVFAAIRDACMSGKGWTKAP